MSIGQHFRECVGELTRPAGLYQWVESSGAYYAAACSRLGTRRCDSLNGLDEVAYLIALVLIEGVVAVLCFRVRERDEMPEVFSLPVRD